MVTIIGVKESQKENGEVFYKLKLQGGVEMVQSKSSGKMYLTARTCYISTTFDGETCKRLIGTQLTGAVEKVQTEPYDYTVPDTGEVISLDYSWEFSPIEPEAKAANQENKELAGTEKMGW